MVQVAAVVVMGHLLGAQAHPAKVMPVAVLPIILEAVQVAAEAQALLVDQLGVEG